MSDRYAGPQGLTVYPWGPVSRYPRVRVVRRLSADGVPVEFEVTVAPTDGQHAAG